jgi:hypothetical protein
MHRDRLQHQLQFASVSTTASSHRYQPRRSFTTSLSALSIALLAILSMTPSANGAESEQELQAVTSLREGYEQRKRRFTDQQLDQKFKIPKVGTLHRPDFN